MIHNFETVTAGDKQVIFFMAFASYTNAVQTFKATVLKQRKTLFLLVRH
jgi:hypothetical protein